MWAIGKIQLVVKMLDKTMIYRTYIGIVVICIVTWDNVSSISAASCENMVRLANLQDIIKNQTNLIEQQGQVIEDLQRRLQRVTTGKT